MPTTSNFGWTTPADTDLVKDGAAAIRTLGNGIDTSLVDLKGGTTGQVLSKASNTDLDFTWVAQDDSNAIQNALLTTTGDTIYASAASTPARLGLGTAGQVLTVNSGATAPEWATPSSGGMTSLASGSLAASGTGVDLQSISSAYNELLLYVTGWSTTTNNQDMTIRLNNDTSGGNYGYQRTGTNNASLTNNTSENGFAVTNTTSVAANTKASTIVRFSNYKNTTAMKIVDSIATDARGVIYSLFGVWDNTSAINRITVISSGTFDSGTYELFGVK